MEKRKTSVSDQIMVMDYCAEHAHQDIYGYDGDMSEEDLGLLHEKKAILLREELFWQEEFGFIPTSRL